MTIRMVVRHIREGFKNLLRNGWMTFASISAVAITLLILGAALVVALNAQQLSTYVSGQLEMDVYLTQGMNDQAGKQVEQAVLQLPGVESVQFISKEEGFKRLEAQVGTQYESIMSNLNQSTTLPVELIVKAKDPRATDQLATQVRGIPGVQNVEDGKGIVDKLFSFLDAVRDVGLTFVIALVITAMFLISNTIRITIFSRRREIEIMRLVGATNWFIRWPFVWEGVLIGLIGAAVPYFVVVYGYKLLFYYSGGAFIALQFPLMSWVIVAQRIATVLFGIGLFIGLWGGVMSVRRFLRI